MQETVQVTLPEGCTYTVELSPCPLRMNLLVYFSLTASTTAVFMQYTTNLEHFIYSSDTRKVHLQ